jgi:periplasmic divalent cation tolerance protein
MTIFTLYSTFPTRDEAISIVSALLEKRLIACANIIDGATSLYRWEGKMQQEQEVLMLAKTSYDKLEAAIESIKALHSYELPCIVAYPITNGFQPFMQWVKGETLG